MDFSNVGDVPLLVGHAVGFWFLLHLCLVPIGLLKRVLYVKGK